MEINSAAQWNDCDLFYIQHNAQIISIDLRYPATIKESNTLGIHFSDSGAIGGCEHKISW